MKKIVNILVKFLVIALAIYIATSFTGCTASSTPGVETDEINSAVIETVDDEEDDVGDTYYYEYYGYAPGDSSGIGYGVQSTKWEYCDSTVLMNPYRGNFECDNSSKTDTYAKFYYIDENTIEKESDGDLFHLDNDYEYSNPYAGNNSNDKNFNACGNDYDEEYTSEEYTAMYGIENLLKLSYFTADELFEISGLEEDPDTNFYSYNSHEVFDSAGTLAFKTDDDEISDIRWYCYYNDYDEAEDLYDNIVKMLEDVYDVTDGYECDLGDGYVMYCCEYDGKEVSVEKYEEYGEMEISFAVREYVY